MNLIIPDYIRNFYPTIYKNSGCKEVEAILQLNNYIIGKVIKKIEKGLQEWTLTEGIDSIYAQRLLKCIETIYVANTFSFMMAKKTPVTTETLQEAMITYLGLDRESLSITIKENTLYITYLCHSDDKKYNDLKQYISFLKSYIPLCIPPYLSIEIRNQYQYTIKEITGKIKDWEKFTIEELEKYKGDKIE